MCTRTQGKDFVITLDLCSAFFSDVKFLYGKPLMSNGGSRSI